MRPTELVLERLEQSGSRPRRSGAGWLAACPAHEDRNPSLSIGEGRDERCLLHCFSGCSTTEVVEALSLRLSDLFPTRELTRR